LEFRYKYGVLGAGAVSASLIGRLPSRTRELGPVSAVSFRVASRIANTLRAGYPVRKADDLNSVSTILFHAQADNAGTLLELLDKAGIDWPGKALVFCDCLADREARRRFTLKGASTAVIRQFGAPARTIVEASDGASRQALHRISRELHTRPVEIAPGAGDLFDAALTLGGAAITPLIDRAAALLREAGIRDPAAARIASSFFEETARDYAHSGKQSWAWYVRKPAVERLRAQIACAGSRLGPVLRQLLLFSFETFQKHADVGERLTDPGDSPAIEG
jgi:hypothetical protein